MEMFKEIERLKGKGATVFIAVNAPDTLLEEASDEDICDYVLIGTKEDVIDKPYEESKDNILIRKRKEDESLETAIYNTILEYDELHPELL